MYSPYGIPPRSTPSPVTTPSTIGHIDDDASGGQRSPSVYLLTPKSAKGGDYFSQLAKQPPPSLHTFNRPAAGIISPLRDVTNTVSTHSYQQAPSTPNGKVNTSTTPKKCLTPKEAEATSSRFMEYYKGVEAKRVSMRQSLEEEELGKRTDPNINAQSKKLNRDHNSLFRWQEERENRLRERQRQQVKEEMYEVRMNPTINKVSKFMIERLIRNQPVEDRLLSFAQEHKEKVQQLKRTREAVETGRCKKSVAGSTEVFDRLYNEREMPCYKQMEIHNRVEHYTKQNIDPNTGEQLHRPKISRRSMELIQCETPIHERLLKSAEVDRMKRTLITKEQREVENDMRNIGNYIGPYSNLLNEIVEKKTRVPSKQRAIGDRKALSPRPKKNLEVENEPHSMSTTPSSITMSVMYSKSSSANRFHEKGIQWKKTVVAKRAQQQQELTHKELEQCTFQPNKTSPTPRGSPCSRGERSRSPSVLHVSLPQGNSSNTCLGQGYRTACPSFPNGQSTAAYYSPRARGTAPSPARRAPAKGPRAVTVSPSPRQQGQSRQPSPAPRKALPNSVTTTCVPSATNTKGHSFDRPVIRQQANRQDLIVTEIEDDGEEEFRSEYNFQMSQRTSANENGNAHSPSASPGYGLDSISSRSFTPSYRNTDQYDIDAELEHFFNESQNDLETEIIAEPRNKPNIVTQQTQVNRLLVDKLLTKISGGKSEQGFGETLPNHAVVPPPDLKTSASMNIDCERGLPTAPYHDSMFSSDASDQSEDYSEQIQKLPTPKQNRLSGDDVEEDDESILMEWKALQRRQMSRLH